MSTTPHNQGAQDVPAASGFSSYVKVATAGVITIGSYFGLRYLAPGLFSSSGAAGSLQDKQAFTVTPTLQAENGRALALPTQAGAVTVKAEAVPDGAVSYRAAQEPGVADSGPMPSSFTFALNSFKKIQTEDVFEDVEGVESTSTPASREVLRTETNLEAPFEVEMPSEVKPAFRAPEQHFAMPSLIDDFPGVRAGQRHLLSLVDVVEPMSDTVIDNSQLYQADVSSVFSSGYDVLSGGSLPSWLSLNYNVVASVSPGGTAYAVALQESTHTLSAALGTSWASYDVFASNFGFLSSTPVTVGVASGITVSRTTPLTLVSTQSGGMLIYEGSRTAPLFRSTYPTGAGGSVHAALLSDDENTAYVANGPLGLDIVDMTVRTSPQRVGNFPVAPGYARGLARSNNLLAVATLSTGVQLVDVSVRTSPQLIGTVPPASSNSRHVAISGPILTVGAQTAGTQVVDITTPSSPQVRSVIPPRAGGSAVAVAMAGRTLVTAENTAGMQISGVAALATPSSLGTYSAGAGASLGLVIGDGRLFVANGGAGVLWLDLRQASLVGLPPQLLGQRYTLTVTAYDYSASVLNSNSFALTLDSLPTLGSSSFPPQSLQPGSPVSLSLNAGSLFTRAEPGFLHLSLQLEDGRPAPSWLSLKLVPNLVKRLEGVTVGASDIDAIDENVLLAGSSLVLVDISTPSSMSIRGSYGVIGITGVTASHTRPVVYAVYDNVLRVYNRTVPTSPSLLSSVPAGGAGGQNRRAVESGNMLYVANVPLGVQAIRMMDSSAPSVASQNPISTAAIAAIEDTVFIGPASGGLQAWNYSAPATPSLRGSSNSSSGIINHLLADPLHNRVFALTSTELQIFDASRLQLRGRLASNTLVPSGLASVGDMVVIAENAGGTNFVDITEDTSPRSLGGYPAGAGSSRGVAIDGSNAFIPNGDALLALDLRQWQLSAAPSTTDAGNYRLRLTATDPLRGRVSTVATWRVEGPPRLNGVFPFQQLFVGQLRSFFVPPNLVTDPNFDVVYINLLPTTMPWFTFNSYAATFFVTPPASAAGTNVTVTLSATDNISGTITFPVTARVSYLPQENQRIGQQLADVGSTYRFTIPDTLFQNFGQGSLQYSLHGLTAQPLSSRLSFNPSTREIVYTPLAADAGSTDLVVDVTNQYGGQASSSFPLVTEYFPRIIQPLGSRVVAVGRSFTLLIPAASDLDSPVLIYQVQQVGGSALPSGYSFSPSPASLSGRVGVAGVLPLRLIVSDQFGASVYDDFTLTAREFPEVAAVPTLPPLTVGRLFRYTLPSATFSGAGLTYNASLADGGPLPYGIVFDAATATFSGALPDSISESKLALQVVASDGQGGSVTVALNFPVQPNFAPETLYPLSNQQANVLQPLNIFIQRSFARDRNNDVLHFMAQFTVGWLNFDYDNVTLHFWGTPSRSDTNAFSPYVFTVTLTVLDSSNAAAAASFDISVDGVSDVNLATRIISIFGGIAGAIWAAIKARAKLSNHWRRGEYGEDITAYIGEKFASAPLKTPAKNIGQVALKEEEIVTYRWCWGKKKVCCTRIKHNRLDAKKMLPWWLVHNEEDNTMVSLAKVPAEDKAESGTLLPKSRVLVVKDRNDNIVEKHRFHRIFRTEESAQLSTSVEGEESKQESRASRRSASHSQSATNGYEDRGEQETPRVTSKKSKKRASQGESTPHTTGEEPGHHSSNGVELSILTRA